MFLVYLVTSQDNMIKGCETLWNIYDEAFLQFFLKKSIRDVWQGPKNSVVFCTTLGTLHFFAPLQKCHLEFT